MDPILAIAKEHNLKVISDCAQSPGANIKVNLQELLVILEDIALIIINIFILVRAA